MLLFSEIWYRHHDNMAADDHRIHMPMSHRREEEFEGRLTAATSGLPHR
jgi:hypothetical protein